MGLEQFLTAEDKVAALTVLRERTFTELYSLCVRAAIDPDTVDYETWQMPEDVTPENPLFTALGTIARMCETLRIIDTKLA